MQSAAKCPFLLSFITTPWKGPDHALKLMKTLALQGGNSGSGSYGGSGSGRESWRDSGYNSGYLGSGGGGSGSGSGKGRSGTMSGLASMWESVDDIPYPHPKSSSPKNQGEKRSYFFSSLVRFLSPIFVIFFVWFFVFYFIFR